MRQKIEAQGEDPEPSGDVVVSPRFDAFISYSHAADSSFSRIVQRELELFGRTSRRQPPLRIFRDETDLSAGNGLTPRIQQALSAARWLILLASPEAARSEWVNRELDWWWDTHHTWDRLLVVVTGGDVGWTHEERTRLGDRSAIPPALADRYDGELVWQDLRPYAREQRPDVRSGQFRTDLAGIAAPLRGMEKNELIGHHIEWERKEARRNRLIAVVSVAAVAVAALAVWFNYQRAEQEALGESRALVQTAQYEQWEDPGLATLLSVAAYQREPTEESRNQLLQQFATFQGFDRLVSGLPGDLTHMDHSDDGRVVTVSTSTGTALVFHWTGGGAVARYEIPDRRVRYALVSGDGGAIVYFLESGEARLVSADWSARDPLAPPVRLPDAPGLEAAPSDTSTGADPWGWVAPVLTADGSTAVAEIRGKIVRWKIDDADPAASTEVLVDALPKQENGGVEAQSFIAPQGGDGMFLTVDGSYGDDYIQDPTLSIDFEPWEVEQVIEDRTPVAISGDGSMIAWCEDSGSSQFPESTWSLVRYGEDSEPRSTTLEGPCPNLDPYEQERFRRSALSPDGRYLIVEEQSFAGARPGTGVIWDTERGGQVGTYSLPPVQGDEENIDLTISLSIVQDGDDLYAVRPTRSTVEYFHIWNTGDRASRDGDVANDVALFDGGTKVAIVLSNERITTWEADLTTEIASARLSHGAQQFPEWNLAVSPDEDLLAVSEDRTKIVVRDSTSLETVQEINFDESDLPELRPSEEDLDAAYPEGMQPHQFDPDGNLLTFSRHIVQRWDPRTGAELARLDLRDAGITVEEGEDFPIISRNNSDADLITVKSYGDPHVKIVSITQAKVVDELRVGADVVAVQLDQSGEYLSTLTTGGVIDLWTADPLEHRIGPIRSTFGGSVVLGTGHELLAGFLDGGRFFIGSNGHIREYDIDHRGYTRIHNFGTAGYDEPGVFEAVYADDEEIKAVAYGNQTLSTIHMDPEAWIDALCTTVGHRRLTDAERTVLPASLDDQEPCAGVR